MTDFREVEIRWRDEDYPQGWESRIVAVDDVWNGFDEDDDVFFWFSSEDEYQDCLINGQEDFEMREPNE